MRRISYVKLWCGFSSMKDMDIAYQRHGKTAPFSNNLFEKSEHYKSNAKHAQDTEIMYSWKTGAKLAQLR